MVRWFKIAFKTILLSVLIVIALLGITWLLLQTETVQNYTTKRVLSWISEKTDHEFSIQHVRIAWFDEVEVKGFVLNDYQHNEMARVNRLTINYDLTELIKTKKFQIEEIHLEEGGINLTKYSDSTELNLSVFLASIEELSEEKDTVEVSDPQPIFLEHIIIEDVLLTMHDSTKARQINKLDPAHLNLRTKLIDISRLYLEPDSISLSLNDMKLSDAANGINIDRIQAKVGFGQRALILDDFIIDTGNSTLGDSLVLTYQNPSALSSFADSVSFFFRIKNSKLGKTDFTSFTGSDAMKGDIYFESEISGKLADIRLIGAKVLTGTSQIYMDASLVGLPDMKETFLDFNIEPSTIYTKDIAPYMGENASALKAISKINVNLSFSGFLNDFSAKGSIKTDQGSVAGDLNVTVPDDQDQTAYTGHLEVDRLNVGKFIGDTSLVQEVSVKGRILGKGITKETASFLTDFTARQVGIKGYVYDSMAFKGYLAAERFYGQFSIDDPNCKINGRTNVDIAKSPESLSLTTSIDTLFTKRLKLSEEDYFVSSRISWKQTHLNPDSIAGTLQLRNLVLREDTLRSLSIDNLDLETRLDSTSRKLKMQMPGIDLQLNGQYTFSNLTDFLQKEIFELSTYFELDKKTVSVENKPMNAELNVNFGDVNQYAKFLSPGLTVSNGATLNVGMEQKEGSDAIISLYAQVDSILYNDDTFLNNEVDLYASLDQHSDDILGSFYISSQEQHWKAVPYSERFLTEGIWLNEKIEVNTSIVQPDTDTSADLHSEIKLFSDSIEFSFKPSSLKALGQTWSFDPANYIRFSKRGLFFRSLDLISNDKRASLNGLLSETENSTVNFVARQIDLQQFNSVLGLPMKGIFEADVSIFKRLDEPVQFEGDFNLYDFIYKNLPVGNIQGNSYYDNQLEAISAKLSVERENVRTISIGGHYFPERVDKLDFTLTFDQADFKLLEFVTEGNLSDVSGYASGELAIKGPTDKPVVTGFCSLADAKFKVDYLGTIYNMNGRIDFKKEEISLRDIVMHDIRGEKAILGGAIRHQNFDNIVTDLRISAKNFNFLNTTSGDNDLFYGQANASGDIFVKGPFDDLILKVNAKTEKGTKFYIPLSGGSTYEQAEFMTFVNLSDTSATESIEESAGSALGLTLDFDLEVTNDAYCELIFDIRTGDIIRGRGNGNLKLRMDKNGNFELFGPLTIEEGGYNFTVPGFINKEFQVVSGSTINWYGDPYTGTMDLSATYRQKASFSDLSSDPADKEDGELTQKYPVIVILELDGQMLSPTLDFDIALDESAAQNQKVTRLLSQVKQDEQQMKRQVVSLLFFKRFSPLQDGFVGGGGGVSIGKSLSEFLTNQISYLASQLDENLEVEVDLTDLDQEGFNTFQLRLAYTFMDGRLKVTRGGDFTSATSEENNVVSDIIGDWTVEYMLTKDGKLRAEMFSQSNQTRLNADGSQNSETGLSLKYVTSFNSFKDLMGKTRNSAIRRKEEESPAEPNSQ